MYRIGKLCLRAGTDQGKLTVSMSSFQLFSTSTSYQKRRKDEKSQPVKSTPGLRSNVKNIIGGSMSAKDPMSVFKPVLVKPNPDDLNFGEETLCIPTAYQPIPRVASDKTHCKPFDLLIPEQWVLG